MSPHAFRGNTADRDLHVGLESFDAIVCDVLMPGMNGIELLAELERVDPRLAATVVFITGGGSGEIEDSLRRAGRPFMNKPPDSARLRTLVTELVQRSRRKRGKPGT